MDIKRNPPVVEQIVTALTTRIRAGEYPGGSKLPSESDLAAEFGVSRASVREALADLDAKGMLWRKHGVGTFVMDQRAVVRSRLPSFTSMKDYVIQAGLKADMQAEAPLFRPITEPERQALEAEAGGELAVLKRTYLADGVPVFICEYLFPLALLNAPLESIDFLLDIPEFTQRYARDSVSAIRTQVEPLIASPAVQESFGLPAGRPVLKLKNIFYGQIGAPIFLNDLFFNDAKIDFFAFYSID
ncbi:MAG: GntR family transcriptional regulator [Chloroflexota bacterium]|nr:GntR family transcriptional regulator [Chloroflexota bacterium]